MGRFENKEYFIKFYSSRHDVLAFAVSFLDASETTEINTLDSKRMSLLTSQLNLTNRTNLYTTFMKSDTDVVSALPSASLFYPRS